MAEVMAAVSSEVFDLVYLALNVVVLVLLLGNSGLVEERSTVVHT